jgi:predicted DsbA family dithiol-disulfide isomerase
MHARLFEHQDALGDDMLVHHAVEIGLDAKRFIADLVDHRFIPRIREDLSSGARSGVNGTPTFFVNGVRHTGAVDVQSLVAALEHTAPVRH